MDKILGGIDILISNAGISIRKKFIETDFAQVEARDGRQP